eukprot:TRINITY_DN13301_c0_g1_i1.p1 TRINITY_DN13301_c0_g1~~TRINITY_DN13301_c0_g1_i1.p1  ORF type:complete len:974 (-),score=126.10 TRINITY_DN13301_c0_g1_i1:2319-5240(-)
MLVRLGALRQTARRSDQVQKRSASSSTPRSALAGRLPLVPIESIDSHKGNCIPLLPEWEPVPLAYRLKQHRFHPVAVNRELKEIEAISIKYIARAMEAAAENGLLTFAVANSFLKAIRRIEKYRATKVVRIKRGVTKTLPRAPLLFAQDYLWLQHRNLKKALKEKTRAGEIVDPLLVPPQIPDVPLDKRRRRKRYLFRVLTESEQESLVEKAKKKAKKLAKKKKLTYIEDNEESELTEASNEELDQETLIYQLRRKQYRRRFQGAILRLVRSRSVSPHVLPILEGKIVPLLEKFNLTQNLIIQFRLALIYEVRPFDRRGSNLFDDILRSLSASTKISTVNFLLHVLVRDWNPTWTTKLLDRLNELNFKGDKTTEALLLSARSQHMNDKVAYNTLRELVRETNDQTARLALLKAALIAFDVRTALTTISQFSHDLHHANALPLDWSESDELFWWTWVFRMSSLEPSPANVGHVTNAWKAFLDAKLRLQPSLLSHVILALNLPPTAPQFSSLVGSDLWNDTDVAFARFVVLARNKQFLSALKLWESSILPLRRNQQLDREKCLQVISLAKDQPSPSLWFPAFQRFIVAHRRLLRLGKRKTQDILFDAVSSQPNPFYTTQTSTLLTSLGYALDKSVSSLVIRRVAGLSGVFEKFLLDTRNQQLLRGTNFAAASPIALFSDIVKRYVVGLASGRGYSLPRAGVDACLVDVFITPGVMSQAKSSSALEKILIRKISLARQKYERLQAFKEGVKEKLPMREVWNLRPLHLRKPPRHPMTALLLYESVIEDFSYANTQWLASNLKSKSLELEVAVTNAIRDRRYPAETKNIKERALLAYGLGPHPYANFFLNATTERLPDYAVGDEFSDLWTVRFAVGETSFLGQGPSLVDALMDMSWKALDTDGSLLTALRSLDLPLAEKATLRDALLHRRELDSNNPQILMALQRIEEAKMIARRSAEERKASAAATQADKVASAARM